jgi:hypothetical protein
LEQFLDELTQTFPEQPALKKYKATFDILRKANPRKIMETFVESVKPFADRIMQKDETFFLNGNIDFLNGLDIKKWWTPELSQGTKDSIWQFLQYLLITSGVAAPQTPRCRRAASSRLRPWRRASPSPRRASSSTSTAFPWMP